MPTQIYRWARRYKDLYCDCCDPPKVVVMCPKINSYKPRKQSEALVDVARFGLPGKLKRTTVKVDTRRGWGA